MEGDFEFSAPTDDDLGELQLSVLSIDRVAREALGRGLTGTTDDLALLQELLDQNQPPRDDAFLLHALGYVVGQLLSEAVLGLAWTMVEDPAGRELVLRWRDTSMVIFPATLLSKPLGRGEAVDVAGLFGTLRTQLEALRTGVN